MRDDDDDDVHMCTCRSWCEGREGGFSRCMVVYVRHERSVGGQIYIQVCVNVHGEFLLYSTWLVGLFIYFARECLLARKDEAARHFSVSVFFLS